MSHDYTFHDIREAIAGLRAYLAHMHSDPQTIAIRIEEKEATREWIREHLSRLESTEEFPLAPHIACDYSHVEKVEWHLPR